MVACQLGMALQEASKVAGSVKAAVSERKKKTEPTK
jgi:hypothetical protein